MSGDINPRRVRPPGVGGGPLQLGWVLLVSIAVVSQSRAVRVAATVLPALMFAAIGLTANHYILDGIVGGVIVLASLAIAKAIPGRKLTPSICRQAELYVDSERH